MRLAAVLVVLIAEVVHSSITAHADEPNVLELTGELGVHDPAIIKAGDTYYRNHAALKRPALPNATATLCAFPSRLLPRKS
jgi:hypothetical protein